jgi:hypothetical protein
MRILLMLLLFPGITFTACAQHDYLVFGKGGGISGEVTEYVILHNGKVLKGSGNAVINFTQRGKIRKSHTRKLYSEFENVDDTSFSHPGNIYYFIKRVGENTERKFTWGDTGYEVSEQVSSLYRNTMFKLSGLTFKPVKKPVK